MISLCNKNLGKNVNFLFFLKKISFIFFVWTYLTYNDARFLKSLENQQENDKILNANVRRLLARYEKQRELQHRGLKGKISDDRRNKNDRTISDVLSTYSRVKGKESNNIDTYMKNYKNRYMKKMGISKLDCYCENKVFEKFCHIRDIAEKMNYDKKRAKSFFLKKYGKALMILALIPAVGLIYPIIFGISRELPGIISDCPDNHFDKSKNPYEHKADAADGTKDCFRGWLYENTETMRKVSYVPKILSFIMITIVILFIIYVLIKVIKYEKIKAGKGKMNMKEYCRFCKDIF
ncbi:Plasmodium exported protein, unknown function [Plasmodium vivax]|uniref:Variable surface protein Vir35 n=2 Tax=Plasmodium vivax TaxID=5855 RepID=A0A1G4EB60_PLAVI|nr:hypothetical protein PVNG_04739 [Plasmodium vivax North Korean]CAI7719046.1 Plasmodium exported protein, unknown function [Plasmodium vivax]CAI7724048.1 Plasmodium exported protein, unknown function [Plasmodium vivax]SCA81717.1 Plasmodium exported protein, unknown function [Plasmodium vivax]